MKFTQEDLSSDEVQQHLHNIERNRGLSDEANQKLLKELDELLAKKPPRHANFLMNLKKMLAAKNQ